MKRLILLLFASFQWLAVEGIIIDSSRIDSLLEEINPDSYVVDFLLQKWEPIDSICLSEMEVYKFPKRIGRKEYYIYCPPICSSPPDWYAVTCCHNQFRHLSSDELIADVFNSKYCRHHNRKIDLLQTFLQIGKPWMYPYKQNEMLYYYNHHDFGFWTKSINEEFCPLNIQNYCIDRSLWQIINDYNRHLIDRWVLFSFGKALDYDLYRYKGKKEDTAILIHVHENNRSAMGFVLSSQDYTAIYLWSDDRDFDTLLAISECIINSNWSNKEKADQISAFYSLKRKQ